MPILVRENGTVIETNLTDLDFTAGLLVTTVAPGVVIVTIPDDGITAEMLADNSITTAKIVDAAVTGAKLAAGAVGTNNVANGAITPAKLDRAYVEVGADVAPAALLEENLAYGGAAVNVTSGTNDQVLGSTALVVPNDAFYEITINAAAHVRSNNSGTTGIGVKFEVLSNGTQIYISAIERQTATSFERLNYTKSFIGRRNETITARLLLSAPGNTNVQYSSYAVTLRGIPRK